MVHRLEKSDCDARKADVGSQSADTIKLNFINGFDDRQPGQFAGGFCFWGAKIDPGRW
jgi:hypothetical protein